MITSAPNVLEARRDHLKHVLTARSAALEPRNGLNTANFWIDARATVRRRDRPFSSRVLGQAVRRLDLMAPAYARLTEIDLQVDQPWPRLCQAHALGQAAGRGLELDGG